MEKIILDVLDIPHLAKNLFLAKQLDKARGEIQIKFRISTFSNKLGQRIAKCKRNNDLYELEDTVIPKQNMIAIPATTNIYKYELRHLELGHINEERLKQIQLTTKGIDCFDIPRIFLCKPYIERKQYK